jgi:hypothetical protein
MKIIFFLRILLYFGYLLEHHIVEKWWHLKKFKYWQFRALFSQILFVCVKIILFRLKKCENITKDKKSGSVEIFCFFIIFSVNMFLMSSSQAIFCFVCTYGIHWTGMLQIMFLVSLESSWWAGCIGLVSWRLDLWGRSYWILNDFFTDN